jgi:hypothetical protein
MRKMTVGALSLVSIAAVWAGPTAAQDVVRDPGVIRSCLCARQSVTALLETLRERQQTYEASQKALASLNNDLEAQRGKIDVYSSAEVDTYKQLLQKRDGAAAAFNGEITASYNAAISRYDQALGGYNANCAGKSYDGAAYSAAQAGLSCPKP